MKITRKRLVLGVIAAIAAIVITFWTLGRSSAPQIKQQGGNPAAASPGQAQAPTILVTAVVSQDLIRQIRLPGELQAYQDVALFSKVQSFVEWIGADRGSIVKRGQLLIRLSAPELAAQRNEAEARARVAQSQRLEAESRVQSTRAQRLEAAAKLASDEATYRRLKTASATPGVVAGNEIEIAQRAVEADRARVQSWEENEKAAQAQVRSLAESEKATEQAARSGQDIESYLRITAPFDGVITERNVHQGSLVGPTGTPPAQPMVRIQQVSRLRLLVPVPETDVAGIAQGARVNFTAPGFPGEMFNGVVQRIGHSLDVKTRTMPVELDVANPSGRLAPGMSPEVIWPSRRQHPSLFVPASAVVSTTERTFVIRISSGLAEWVDIKRGASMGSLVEVFGDLTEGDQVAVRGTDELRAGSAVIPRQAPSRP